MPSLPRSLTLAAVAAACAAAAFGQTYPPGAGPNPELPPPHEQKLLPTVHIAPAQGWPKGAMPKAPAGFTVTAFAAGLEHPRWVYTLPNGDVLVAESNAPPPKDGQVDKMSKGLTGKAMKFIQKRAGAGVPSPNRIMLLRDTNGDGVADTRTVFMSGLFSPFGMVLVGNELYIADADAIVKVAYHEGDTSITEQPVKVTDLPAGANHHWTKNVIASADGSKLYATVGSNSNILDNGLAAEEGRAAIWEIDRSNGDKRLFATGLRNPNGMGWEPQSKALWVVVNERDQLGNDLVPDYLTSVKDGAFYGWPWSYWGQP
jgi:glucose/arabinose dehydrogenase